MATNTAGAMEEARTLASDAHAAATSAGDRWLEGLSLMFLALIAQYTKRYEEARPLYDECLLRFRATGDKWAIGMALTNIAGLSVLQEDYALAKAAGTEAIVISQELSDARGTAWCLEMFAAAAANDRDARRAGILWGSSESLLERVGSPLPHQIQLFRNPYFERASELLGEGALQAAMSEGRAMSLTEAVQYALCQTTHDGVSRDALQRGQAG